MAFRKKADVILKYKPDILVVPECEHTDKLKLEHSKTKLKNSLWFGENQHKGLAVFSFNNYTLEVISTHNDSFKLIVPVLVKKENFRFILFAIWAHNPNDKDGQYVTQVWKALHYYDELISNNKVVLTGDFNSNTIWDKPKRNGNHSHVVDLLAAKNIYSIYHTRYKQIQGKEKHPTFYLYKHADKPYHLDYCFASAEMFQYLKSVKIGDFETWKTYSDHVPVIVNFNKSMSELL
jgi:exonuclease III